MKKPALRVLFWAVACCAVMAVVDGVLRPGYALKSAIKAGLFLLVPLLLSLADKDVAYLRLLRPKRKGLGIALLLGVGVYAVILGAYFIMGP